MNALLLKKFTPEILRGAKSLGVEPDLHRGTLRVGQAEEIERQTGRSISELAMLGIGADASTTQRKAHRELLRETMELLATFDSNAPIGQKPGLRQPAVQRRP